jgi:CheY-like chemotaxis protein
MKQHILLIDDDKDEIIFFLDALRKVPHDDGFKCTYAGKPGKALEMLKLLIPDFIFVDLNMPEMNGLEFIALIKGQSQLKNTKICLYSRAINESISRLAAHLGADCVKKPSSINELAEDLSRLLVNDSDLHQDHNLPMQRDYQIA